MRLNVLSEKDENKLLLKEYLLLESQNKELTYALQEVSTKAKRLEREQLKVQTNFIKKKQYIDLNAKYRKAKQCLEGTFLQLRELRKMEQENEQSVAEEVNELLEGVEVRECHNFITATNQVVTDLHEKISGLEEKTITNDVKLELVHSQNTIVTMKRELESSEKILHLMNDDIALKNRLIFDKN